MEKTKMHIVAGILAVVAAVMKLFISFGLIIALLGVGNNPAIHSAFGGAAVFMDIPTLMIIVAVTCAVLGIMGMAGGVCALQGKRWTLALTGSIAAALPFSILGIAAFVVVVLTRDEFEQLNTASES